MNRLQYASFLLSRLFVAHEYSDNEALLDAINSAKSLSPENDWRGRKRAFNAIGCMSVMRDIDGVIVTLENVPEYIDAECTAYLAYQNTLPNIV